MFKKWLSHKKYLHFLKHCKARMNSSQRIRWKELRPIRKRLKSLNLDAAGVFMFPLYSSTGRPALNQPQILRSFILWFLLFRQGLVKLSLTEWVEKLKGDELYSNLIGCSSGSSPPLGSYYDFIDRLWAAPLSDWYSRNKTFPSNVSCIETGALHHPGRVSYLSKNENASFSIDKRSASISSILPGSSSVK